MSYFEFARDVLVIGQLLAVACLKCGLGVAAHAGATPSLRTSLGVLRTTNPH